MFAPALNGATITLDRDLGSLSITDSVTIDATNLPAGIAISGNDPTPTQKNGDGITVLTVNAGTDLNITLSGLTITGGDSGSTAGGIVLGGGGTGLVGGVITLNKTRIVGNGGANLGGGVVLTGQGTQFTIVDSVISGNEARHTSNANDPGSGGGVSAAIFSRFLGGQDVLGKLTISRTVVSDNIAAGNGGGVAAILAHGRLEILDSLIQQNESTTASSLLANLHGGGGVYAELNIAGSSVLIDRTTLHDNQAQAGGGGVFIVQHRDTTATLRNSTVSSNRAIADQGGGVNVCGKDAGLFEAVNVTISDNEALASIVGRGGGVYFATLHDGSLRRYFRT